MQNFESILDYIEITFFEYIYPPANSIHYILRYKCVNGFYI